jgi:hypothetical protein
MTQHSGEFWNSIFRRFRRHTLSIRHFLLLALWSAACYIIVPILHEKIVQDDYLTQRREELSLGVIKESFHDSEDLNAITTTFAIFQKGELLYPGNRLPRQNELRKQYSALYLEFDHHAWWWPEEYQLQANLLHYSNEDKGAMNTLSDQYKKNLASACNLIDQTVNILLDEKFDPKNEKTLRLIQNNMATLQRYNSERADIIGKLSFVYMRPVAKPFYSIFVTKIYEH